VLMCLLQLAVELAQKFNGEIINGDAMQMYEGLPIITNKMPLHERKGVPHHLLGGIGLDKPTWTVGQFVTAALEIVCIPMIYY
jgi:tRNA dimethylallyltransferase